LLFPELGIVKAPHYQAGHDFVAAKRPSLRAAE
jgi:hypothetical protein